MDLGCHILQNTGAINQDSTPVLQHFSGLEVLHLKSPDAFLVVPGCSDNGMLQLDVFV